MIEGGIRATWTRGVESFVASYALRQLSRVRVRVILSCSHQQGHTLRLSSLTLRLSFRSVPSSLIMLRAALMPPKARWLQQGTLRGVPGGRHHGRPAVHAVGGQF